MDSGLDPFERVIENAVQRHFLSLHPRCTELLVLIDAKTRLELLTHSALRGGRRGADRGMERFGRAGQCGSAARLPFRIGSAGEHVEALDHRRLVSEPLRKGEAVRRERSRSPAIAFE